MHVVVSVIPESKFSFVCLIVSVETPVLYNETETSENITDVTDFINKTVIPPDQVTPPGKRTEKTLKMVSVISLTKCLMCCVFAT